MKTTLKRQELYDLVWSEPMKSLATRFGISDVALAKHCDRHEIPVPRRGYWQMLQAGKRVYKPELPPRGLGMSEVVHFGGNARNAYYWQQPDGLLEMETPPPPEFPEPIPDLIARVQRRVGKVTVPRTLDKPHRLIARLLAEDEARRERQSKTAYKSSFDSLLYDSPFEKRRLRLLNALFIALERADMAPSFRGKDPAEFSVRIGTQHVGFKLDHPGQLRGYRTQSDLLLPASHALRLELSSWKAIDGVRVAWEDSKDHRIEDDVGEMVVALIVAGEVGYRQNELGYNAWLVQRKASRIEELRRQAEEREQRRRERLIRAEKARVERLLGEAAGLRRAADIRAYVESARRANAVAPDPVPGEQMDAWAAWALAQADRIDPVLTREFLKPPAATETEEADD